MTQVPTEILWVLVALAGWGVVLTLMKFLARSNYEENPMTVLPSRLPQPGDPQPGEPPPGYRWMLVPDDD